MRSRRPASTGTGGGVGSPSRWLLRGPCRAWSTAACRGCSLVGRRREGREALAGGRRAGMRGAHMGRGGWGSKMLEGLGVCAVDNPGTAARSGPGPSTPAPARAAGSSSSAAGRAGSRWTWPAPASGSMGWIRPARWSAQPVPTPSRPASTPTSTARSQLGAGSWPWPPPACTSSPNRWRCSARCGPWWAPEAPCLSWCLGTGWPVQPRWPGASTPKEVRCCGCGAAGCRGPRWHAARSRRIRAGLAAVRTATFLDGMLLSVTGRA